MGLCNKKQGSVLIMYLLDTNHASRILQAQPDVVRRFAQVGRGNAAIPFVVCGEMIYMAEKSQKKNENLKVVLEFIEEVRVVHSDLETCAVYGHLKVAFVSRFGPKRLTKRSRVKLHQIGLDDNDLWIAATAIRHHLTLVSADTDFERIRAVHEFRLESWWQPEILPT